MMRPGRTLRWAVLTVACAALLLAGVVTAQATTWPEPSFIKYPGEQSGAVPAATGIVFQHSPKPETYDLYFAPYDGEPEMLAGGAGDQCAPVVEGEIVAFLNKVPDPNTQKHLYSIEVIDLSTRDRETVVEASHDVKWAPDLYGSYLVWAQGPSGSREIWGAALDADSNGIIDVFEGADPPTPERLVTGAADFASYSRGPHGLTYSRRVGSASASIEHRSDPGDHATTVTLDADTGYNSPETDSAGNLAVWPTSGGIGVHDFGVNGSTVLGMPAGWTWARSPTTDGTYVAWYGLRVSDALFQVFAAASDDTTGQRVSPTSAWQLGPNLGAGRLAWADWRTGSGHYPPDIAYVAVPAVPVTMTSLSSSSHPDEGTWYSDRNVEVSWEATSPSGIDGYSTSWETDPNETPDENVDTYDTSASVTADPDGTWYFKVRARGGNGVWSEPITRIVRVDATDPTGSITIADGAEYTGSQDVVVTNDIEFGASGAHATEAMRFDVDDGSGWGDGWIPFESEHEVTLPEGDGEKTVKAQFRDAAGNVSDELEDTIILDSTVPVITVISSGSHSDPDTWYSKRDVEVSWEATSPSGIDGYSYTFSKDPAVAPDTEVDTYDTAASFSDKADGKWYFKVKGFNGDTERWGSPSTFVVQVDATDPTGSITLASGATHTATRDVVVTSDIEFGESGPHKTDAMRFDVGDGAGWSGWLPFEDEHEVTLPAGDGVKTVKAQFKDAADNESAVITDTIVLECPKRLSDRTRFSTALAIAKEGFPGWEGVTDVVIASGDDRAAADPLAASGLCWAYEAPLLLVSAARTPDEVKTAIAQIVAENGPVTLRVVGGPVSVPEARLNEIKAHVGPANVTVDRIRETGSRFDLAASIAMRMRSVAAADPEKTMPSVALLANGADATKFFDALALSPISAGTGAPILLVAHDTVPGATANALSTLNPATRIVGGGPMTVSDAVLTQLGATRWSGRTRYDTAIDIANGAVSEGWLTREAVGVAAVLPDALTGGAFVGLEGGVLVLTDGSSLTPATQNWLISHKTQVKAAYVFGGPNSVSPGVKTQIRNALQ